MIKYQVCVLGAGCYWCLEGLFQILKGVVSVKSGFAGGEIANPNYKQVCKGNSGHAEVCQIVYDPRIIKYSQILDYFFDIHDAGQIRLSNYRSIILYTDEKQRQAALLKLEQLKTLKKIVTEIKALDKFYETHEQHQDYYKKNQQNSYCQMVTKKMKQLKLKYKQRLM